MTDVASRYTEPASIRIATPTEPESTTPIPKPGPMAIFVILLAMAAGITTALAFQTTKPDTPFIILGGTVLCAVILGIVGLYRFQWFVLGTLAIRPALDDLIADEFGSFQPSAILGILVVIVCSLHLISSRFSGKWNRLTPLGWAYAGFFLMFVPSFITSVDRGVSQAAMFGLASVTLFYLAMEQQLQKDRTFMNRMLLASGIGLIVPIATGFTQFFWTGSIEGSSGLVRIDGSFAHPNTFGTYLVFALLLTIGVLPTLEVKKRAWALVLALLTGFIMIATFARGAWASFLLGSLLMASRVNKRLVWVIMFGSVAVAAAVPGVGDRLANLTATTGEGGGVKTDDSIGWRIGYWGKVWPFFYRNPLTGIGIDATKTQTFEGKDPHNSFIQPLIEGGVLGGLGFFTLVFLAGVASVRVWRRIKSGELEHRTRMISIGCIAGVLSIGAQLLTENVLLNTVVWWYLNIAMAFLAVLTWQREPSVAAEPDVTISANLPTAGETHIYSPQGTL